MKNGDFTISVGLMDRMPRILGVQAAGSAAIHNAWKAGADDVVVTGGGIIPEEDMNELVGMGVDRLFGPGSDVPREYVDVADAHQRVLEAAAASSHVSMDETFSSSQSRHVSITET